MPVRTSASPKLPRGTRRHAVGLAVAAMLAAALPALADTAQDFPACTRDPSAADVDGAAGAHKAAKAYYERGEYDKAIDRWREAYSFDCTKPAVFLNLANAYERKGDKASTVAMLELYLSRAPKEAPDLATIATRVNNLKTAIKNEAPAASATPAASGAPSAPGSAGPAPTGGPAPETPAGARPFGVIPWIVAGVGGAAILTGAILLPVGAGKESDAAAQCPDRGKPGTLACPADVVDAGNAGILFQRLGVAMLVVGGAAVAGGLVWEFKFNEPKAATPPSTAPANTTGQAASRVTVAPSFGPGHAGALVSGRF